MPLNQKRSLIRRRTRLKRLLLLGIAVAAAAALAAKAVVSLVPFPTALRHPPIETACLTDRRGTPLRELGRDNRFAEQAAPEKIPPALRAAIIAAEDKRFYHHHGIDFLALARSLGSILTHGHATSGASTISEQLVKISEPRRRTLATKLIEAAKALRIEKEWTKEAILVEYLNRVDFGNLNIGCAEASRYYFGKPPGDLSVAEASFLAGLPQSPTRLNPYRRLAEAKHRQETVLIRMRDAGFLTASACERALAEPIRLEPNRRVFQAPHFADLVLSDPDSAAAAAAGSEIRTTLDLPLNRVVELSVRKRLAGLRDRRVQNAAVVVIENATGAVRALVGSGDYFAPGSGQVNGAAARRSAGSTFKPFTYLLALEQGATPATVIPDLPASFPSSTGLYPPENYNRRYFGPVRYRTALSNSLNVPAVKVLAALGGPVPLRNRLRQWGLTTLEKPADDYGLGLTIGNAETRLIELANAYACLARLGDYRPCHLLEGREANTAISGIASSPSPATRTAAWLIADMLSDNAARRLAFGSHSALEFDFRVACKTGTSTDFCDNWAIGYTPEFTVGVWAGNFDGAPTLNVSGVTGAAPILHDVFDDLHARFGTTWYSTPDEIVHLAIDPLTGKRVPEGTPGATLENFARTNLPPVAAAGDYDASGRLILGAAYADWLSSGDNWFGDRAVTADSASDASPGILSPAAGTIYVLDPDLPSTSRRLPLQSVAGAETEWTSDSLAIETDTGTVFAVMKEGTHRITARNPRTGKTSATWVTVKAL